MVALAIIYNHKYDKNIPILEEIYKDKFSHIFHLVPFYTGDKENVVPVYENSFYFQGYIAQAFQKLQDKGKFDHYIFIGDDLLLNPQITQNNYNNIFSINKEDSFITLFDETSQQGGWPHLSKIQDFSIYQDGLEIRSEFPDKETILKKFHQNNLKTPFIYSKDRYPMPSRNSYAKGIIGYLQYKRRHNYIKQLLKTSQTELEFPLVCGYSDILIVAEPDMRLFAHYCGLFAAGRLFVEAAIPTAMVIACKKIVTTKDLKKDYLVLWDKDREKFEQEYKSSIDYLCDNFPENILYIHPVKLSKWFIK